MIHQPLKITVVEPRGSGGMIHYAYQLCTALADEGASVTLLTSTEYELDGYPHNFSVIKLLKLWSPTDVSDESRNNNIIIKFSFKVFRKIRRVLRGVRFINEWVRLMYYLISNKSDIVQFGKIEFPFEAIFLAILKLNGLVLSQICHEFEMREQENKNFADFANQLHRWVYHSFSLLFFHSKNNKDRFSSLFNVDPAKFHLIPHGNENLFLSARNGDYLISENVLRAHYKIDPSAPVVLFFGNLMPSKGIPDLLEAFKLVQMKHTQVRLVVAGKPTKHLDLNTLVGLASRLGIAETTVFDSRYIPIEDVASLMGMASVVVYPYLNSTQSGSLQVAYAFGRPVIATSVGGLPDAVDDGRSGFLIPPRNPEKLAEAIMRFIDNPNLTYAMGSYAKHLSETRFSWNTAAKIILAAYGSIAGRSRGNSG